MSDQLTLTDNYGDYLVLTPIDYDDSSRLDVTITEGETSSGVIIDEDNQRRLRDFLNTLVGDEERESETANETKLAVAAEFSLRAKFSYTGDDDYGIPRERRVEVENVWDASNGYTLVGGESYDENGDAEGYRQFRLDRINGAVVIR